MPSTQHTQVCVKKNCKIGTFLPSAFRDQLHGKNISWFHKKGHQILKGGGVQWSDRGVQYISLPRMTNLAYLNAKGIFKLKLPSQAQG